MDYGSAFYVFSLLLLLSFAAATWALLRRRTKRTQQTVILAFMLINVFQHFFKSVIYPPYFGDGFTAISTAYNMCAVLIIFSPIALIFRNRFLKNFVFYIGSVAGIAAIAVPYWFIGKDPSEIGWEYVRFYLCHSVLFVTSITPLLLDLHRPSYKEFWQVGLSFSLALCIIVLNDIVFICMGLYPGATAEDLYASLLKLNPCLVMGPPKSLPWVADIVKLLSPSVFCGNNPAGLYVPVLWYAIPGYLGISLIAFIIFSITDRKQLSADVKYLYGKFSKKGALQ